MAARRSLGGGRVLGDGKGLVPPPPSTKPPITNHGLLSPSASSVSLSSQASSAAMPGTNEDLTSQVALGHASAQAAAAASSRMVCPICNEEMMTLLQLNRHIDDNHTDLEAVEQDEAKTWFKQQMVKAKKFQPLQALNQKLRGLDVFESNNDISPPASATPPPIGRGASPARAPSTAATRPVDTVLDPDDIITKSHWQRFSGFDTCSDPLCGKRLGAQHGQVNCRSCGKLFCDEHTMYQMKLSRSAQHEPVRGLWYRVCETCYKTREGYNDHNGFERSHMEYFKSMRRKVVDKQTLETSRLESRLTRLTQLLADPPPPDSNQSRGLWHSLAGKGTHVRILEQTIVPWEDDATVNECPFCQQPFSQYTLRRHHCRTCGRVVCGDPATACSSEIGLDVDSKKGTGKVPVDIRLCKDCQRTIFSKADFARELATPTPDQKAYSNLVQFEHGIRLLLPRFQRLLTTFQDPEKPPTPAQLAEASKVRKRLTDSFTQYDFAARRVRDMPTTSSTQQKLQTAIYQQAMSFLHVHMLPLKSLPKIMKHATPSRPPLPATNGSGKPQSALASIKYNDLAAPNSSNSSPHRPASSRNSSSASSAAVTALEAEERELRERLIVLEEQKFLVQEMIVDANKRRKFDEVSALAQNVEDLSKDIDQIQGQLAGMDFVGAYTADAGVIK